MTKQCTCTQPAGSHHNPACRHHGIVTEQHAAERRHVGHSLPVQQRWVCGLSLMQQSVLLAAVRAPDGLRKNHPVKVLMRWYRRSILISAFDRKALDDPFAPGGGSFTGPFTVDHAVIYKIMAATPLFGGAERFWRDASDASRWRVFNEMRKVYLEHVDEIPHHFQLHLMHAAQIIGYKHEDLTVRAWWREFYEMIVNDAHLFPESEELMDKRLGDNEGQWRAREEVTAK